ncbi:MAG: penicillin-binding protein 2 [Deltaproteobacteria bacterium]|nr:MAG: penicillin-binding protein 2 [Deltaproteobacteria bacterium]
MGSGQAAGREYLRRYVYAVLIAVGALCVLAGRLYWLQVVRGEHYARLSRSNFVKAVEIPADRGMILDRRGTIVVDSRPSYDVALTPAFCPDPEQTLGALAGVLGFGLDEVRQWTKRVAAVRGLERFRPIVLKEDVGRDALDWIDAHRLELDGVDVRIRPRRNYRFGKMLAHVLGYMNEIGPAELERARARGLDYELGDAIGRAGLEERFESVLRGKDGLERVVVDAKGRRIDAQGEAAAAEVGRLIPEEERIRPSVPGHNLVLTIDMRLQRVAEEAFPGRAGSVVALDPQTGYVLAMVSRPAFDPNRLSGGITKEEMQALAEDPYEPMLHRAIQEHYHPGSTFKVVTAIAGLEEGVIRPSDTVTCNGGYTLGRRRWRCWRAAGHGRVALYDALQHSCDVYFYALGDRLDIDPIAKWARALGFGAPTGLPLPHEIPGIVPDVAYHERVSPEGYQRGFALNTAIGQGDVNVTNMQLAVAYMAIANGGIRYRPQVVLREEDAEGRVVREFLPEIVGRVGAKPETLAEVVEGLRRVVMEPGGTAYYRRPRHLDVQVAGKTGTAQVVKMGRDRVSSDELDYWHRDHAWFVAFAPVEHPEIVVSVVNEHGGHGSSGAAPTAVAVIEAYFELKAQDAAERHGAHEVEAGQAPAPAVRERPRTRGRARPPESPPALRHALEPHPPAMPSATDTG